MSDFTRLRLIWEPRLLSISRIMIGLLFMEHGTAKVLDFPHQETHKIFDLLTLNPGAQGLIELIGGFLFAVGLFTRPVAFILAGDVAVAYFMAHAPRGFFPLLNGGELAIVYCFAFLYFWLAGGGEWSLDRLLGREAVPPRNPVRCDPRRRALGREPRLARPISGSRNGRKHSGTRSDPALAGSPVSTKETPLPPRRERGFASRVGRPSRRRP